MDSITARALWTTVSFSSDSNGAVGNCLWSPQISASLVLCGGGKSLERSNEDQLIKWLKKDFENIVSHKDYKSKLNTSEDAVELHATE